MRRCSSETAVVEKQDRQIGDVSYEPRIQYSASLLLENPRGSKPTSPASDPSSIAGALAPNGNHLAARRALGAEGVAIGAPSTLEARRIDWRDEADGLVRRAAAWQTRRACERTKLAGLPQN